MPTTSFTMPRNLVVASLRALIVAALIGYLYAAFVHQQVIDSARIAQLAIRDPGIPVVIKKPSSTQVIDTTSSPFKAVRDAEKSDPAHTGGYSTIWNGPPKSQKSAVMVFDLLPTVRQANQVIAQANQEFFTKKAFKVYTREIPITIPTIPNSTAYRLFSAATAQSPKSQTVMVVFRVGRVAVVDLVSAPVVQSAEGVKFAQGEHDLLVQREPTFYLSYQGRSVVISFFYFLGGALVVLLGFGGPTWLVEARQRRQEEREAAIRRHYQVRGSKVLKRQRGRSTRR